MMEGWEKYKLGEIYGKEKGKIQTGPFGSQLHQSDYKISGVPVIMPKDIVNNRIDKTNIAHISSSDADRLKRHIVKLDDVIYPRRGEINKRAIIKNEQVGFFCGTGCIRLRGSGQLLNQLFFFHYLQLDNVVDWIEKNAIGATMLNLSTSIFNRLPIHLPPLATQHRIAKILSAYDDLIENNLRRIKLLEEMAQKTYEEWFVRFKFPGHETAVFDEETGLPEGWKKRDLKEYISVKHGYAYKGEYFTEKITDRILLTPGNFKIGGGIQLKKIKYYSNTAECPEVYILEREDLLLTMTDLSKMGDTLGYPLLVPTNKKTFLHNQRLGKVIPVNGKCFPKYFYCFYQLFFTAIEYEHLS